MPVFSLLANHLLDSRPVQAPQHIRNKTSQKHKVVPVREIVLDGSAGTINTLTVSCGA